MEISLIAAIGPNREIGHNNKLLWHLPADLRNFKQLTLGHHIMMGRKTFASIGKALPGRTNIILTRRGIPDTPGCIVVDNFELGLQIAQESGEKELFIIGGGELFTVALPLASKLYLSTVEYAGPADTFFPAFAHLPWQQIHKEVFAAEEATPAWTYQVLQKKPEKNFNFQ